MPGNLRVRTQVSTATIIILVTYNNEIAQLNTDTQTRERQDNTLEIRTKCGDAF